MAGERHEGETSLRTLVDRIQPRRIQRMLRTSMLLLASLLALMRPGWDCALGVVGPPVEEAVADPLGDGLDAEFDRQPAGFPDPLERLNRGTLRLNQSIDHWLLDPVTRVYRFIVPDPARQAVRRVLANLNSPAVMVNDLLQGEWKDAGATVTRFVLNSSAGVAGIFDPAARLGVVGHFADFGQTLALAGVGSGPFLMLPILGPTTARDGAGSLVDVLFRPSTWVLGPVDQLFYTTIEGSSEGLVARDTHAAALQVLEDSSVDYYAALRNAYYQSRTAEIWSRWARRRPDCGAPGETSVAARAIELRVPAKASAVANPPELSEPARAAVARATGERSSALEVAGREVGDLGVDGADERREAVALEH